MITGQTMQTDARSVPVSACAPGSLEDYETAIVQFQSYFGDPTETLEATLKNDPEFVLGHIFNARVVADLYPIRSIANRFGGSNAQRDILT